MDAGRPGTWAGEGLDYKRGAETRQLTASASPSIRLRVTNLTAHMVLSAEQATGQSLPQWRIKV